VQINRISQEATMLLRQKYIAATILVSFFLGGGIGLAQSGSETDPRFEKLAQDLYPKARQGAVYQ
jgi:hypothetical protein